MHVLRLELCPRPLSLSTSRPLDLSTSLSLDLSLSTSLLCACQRIAEVLVTNGGADASILDEDGRTPLSVREGMKGTKAGEVVTSLNV